MKPLEACLLGIVQGLTEFLPVSSSGHLVLGKKVLGVSSEMPVTFEVVVHAGTLLATLIVFWRPVADMLVFLGRAVARKTDRKVLDDPAGRMVVLILIGTIPAGAVGFLGEDAIEALFTNALLVGVALCVTGAILFATRWAQSRGKGIENVSVGKGLLVGVAQALAITPGISRSGATIATGLLAGIDRDTAVRFSFLLSMPAIAGATVLKARDIADAGSQAGWSALLLGFLSSLVVGYVALRLLLAFVRRGRLHWFAFYCWLVGLISIVAYASGYLRN